MINLLKAPLSIISRCTVFIVMTSICLSISSCVEPINPYSAIAPGVWRGVLYIDPNKSVNPSIEDQRTRQQNLHQENDSGILPFLFEIIYENDTSWYVEILNGVERIPVRNLTYERTRAEANKTLTMDFVVYDSHIQAVVKEDIMQGHFIVRSKDNYRIPFSAFHAQKDRFIQKANSSQSAELGGRWEVTFEPESDDEYKAIGDFSQNGNHLSGTFLTETGDYRYLDGMVEGNKMWLSVFDGAHAFLFHAKEQPDGSLQGIFRIGKHYQSTWIAHRNDDFILTHPDSLSRATTREFSLTMPNENGIPTTFPNPNKKGVKILQIMGTWCPNCKDETEFLVDYLKAHPDLPLDITAIAFERYPEEAKALAAIRRYKEAMQIPYPILWGGKASKKSASQALPMIDKVISYPTMIILDKKNKVRKVHTGFSGPATSTFESFSEDFNLFIEKLAAE